jgi:undecaprenyl-diphosphatase
MKISKKYSLRALIVGLSALCLFAVVCLFVISRTGIFGLDARVNQALFLVRSASLTPFMIFITDLISPKLLPLFALGIILWLAKKKDWKNVWVVVGTLGGSFVSEYILKILIARPRPLFSLVTETDYSFPSGHATMAAAFFGLLIYLFAGRIKKRALRSLFVLANLFLFLAVSFSRLYLGVHWLSDVLGGSLLGLAWLAAIVWSWPFFNEISSKIIGKLDKNN